MSFQTRYISSLTADLTTTATTISVKALPTATAGRMALVNGTIYEWISYTAISGTPGSAGNLTGVTRGLSQTADPVTGGTGLFWGAGTTLFLTAMHDQISDKELPFPIVGYTTAEKLALDMSSDYFTGTYPIIYDTTLGQYQYYTGSAWTSFATGTVADASTTTSGKIRTDVAPVGVPVAFTTDNPRYAATAGNNTDVAVGTGNKLVTQTGLQHGAEQYAVISSASTTAYVVTLSPAPTSLTAGMPFKAKVDVTNTTTTPTINVNGIGAKTIVKGVSTALGVGEMPANLIADFVYDGTNVVLLNPVTPATFTNGVTTRTANTASGTQTIAHGGGKVPKFVELSANYANAVSGTVSNTAKSEGCYNGTTNSCIYEAYTLGNGAGSNALTTGNSSTQGIYIQQSGTAGNTQVGVITVDATNITITWTLTGTLSANLINILWKASF